MLILLFFVSIAAFALVSMAPLDPLQTNVGQAAMGSMSPEQIERLRLYCGEGIPPLKRYLAWAGDFIRGNMGISKTHLCLYSCYGFNFYVRKLLGFCLLRILRKRYIPCICTDDSGYSSGSPCIQ